MPSMLRMNSYDTICHEHLEYYSITAVKAVLEAAGLRVLDVQMNSVNGGSFAVTACKKGSRRRADTAMINWLLEQEKRMGMETPRPFREFEDRVFRHRDDLRRLITALVQDGKRIVGYGASTKGNVLLQFCGLGPDEIPAIADVNPDKFGCVTPGTHIPIVSEAEARAMEPDYLPRAARGISRAGSSSASGIPGEGWQDDLPVPGDRNRLTTAASTRLM